MIDNKYLISFSETQFKAATAILSDELEDVFYCLGFQYTAGDKTRFLIKHALNPYEFTVDRSVTHVAPSMEFLRKLYSLLRKDQAEVVLQIHWHKFCEKPEFSGLDDNCAFLLLEDAKKFNTGVRAVQIVFGRDSKYFKARYLSENNFVYFDNIEIIGTDGIMILPKKENIGFGIESIFEKNVLTFTREGMEKIAHTIVAVVGTGGIGSGLLYQMARIDFRYMNIIDPDFITADNCNRLHWVNRPKDAIGKFKVGFIAKAYRRFNPRAKIRYFIGKANTSKARRLMKRADLIILCVDNDSIRAIVNSFAAQYCKPMVNVATGIFMNKGGDKIEQAGSMIQWFIPREVEYPCLRCHGSLDQKQIQQELMDESQKENRKNAGYITNTTISPEPQVMPLNGIGISIAMWQICCWIAGIRKPEPWTYYDAVQNKLINIQVKQNPDCSCCGSNEMSILALGDYKQELVKI